MKFRTVTIWIALVSTGMLCLAVGAVRIPRKPRNPLGQSESSSSTRNEQQETATVIPMRVEPPGRQPAMSNFPGQNQTSPTSAAWGQPVRSQAASQQPQRQSIDRFVRIPNEPSTAGSGFKATGQFVAAPNPNSTSNRPGSYQEPEAWPFHRSPNAGSPGSPGSSLSDGTQQFSAARPTQRPDSSEIAEWPYRPASPARASGQKSFQAAVTERQPAAPQNSQPPYQPDASFESVACGSTELSATQTAAFPNAQPQPWSPSQPETSDDLLNPAFAFGLPPRSASTQQQTFPTHKQPTAHQFEVTQPHRPSLNQLTDPFGSTSSLSETPSQSVQPVATPPQSHVQLSAPPLASFPAPQPSPNQPQSILEAPSRGSHERVRFWQPGHSGLRRIR
jgi:hypothetical protein